MEQVVAILNDTNNSNGDNAGVQQLDFSTEILNQFFKDNEAKTSFVSSFGSAQNKKRFVDALVANYISPLAANNNNAPQDLEKSIAALRILRLLCRENVGLETVLQKKTVRDLCTIAGLLSPNSNNNNNNSATSTTTSSRLFPASVSIEALKALLNVMHQGDQRLRHFMFGKSNINNNNNKDTTEEEAELGIAFEKFLCFSKVEDNDATTTTTTTTTTTSSSPTPSQPVIDYERYFCLARLVFYASFDRDNARELIRINQDLPQHLIKFVIACLEEQEEKESSSSTTDNSNSNPNLHFVNCVVEVLKALYSFTAHLDLQQPDTEHIIYTKNLSRLIELMLRNKYSNTKAHFNLWKHTTHLLLNAPDQFLVDWLTTETKQVPAQAPAPAPTTKPEEEEEGRDTTVLENGSSAAATTVATETVTVANEPLLIELIKYCLFMEDDESLKLGMTPLIVVLTNAAKASPIVRATLKAWLLDNHLSAQAKRELEPVIRKRYREEVRKMRQKQNHQQQQQQKDAANNDRDVNNSSNNANNGDNGDDASYGNTPTLKQVVSRFMCHYIYDLKRYVGELLFILCDEDASELIDYVGTGYAAGILVEKGLFSQSDFARM